MAAARFDPLVVQQASANTSRLKLAVVPKEEVAQALEKSEEKNIRLKEENQELVKRGPKDAALIAGIGTLSTVGFQYVNGRWGNEANVYAPGGYPLDLTLGTVGSVIGLGLVATAKTSKRRNYVGEGILGFGLGAIASGAGRAVLQMGINHRATAHGEQPPPPQVRGAPVSPQLAAGQATTTWDGQTLTIPQEQPRT